MSMNDATNVPTTEDVVMADATTSAEHTTTSTPLPTSASLSTPTAVTSAKAPASSKKPKSNARLASQAELAPAPPAKSSKDNDGNKQPADDIEIETNETPSEKAAAIAVAQGLSAYWDGVLDGQEGTKNQRAPSLLGGNLELQYLKGVLEGPQRRVKGLFDPATARPIASYGPAASAAPPRAPTPGPSRRTDSAPVMNNGHEYITIDDDDDGLVDEDAELLLPPAVLPPSHDFEARPPRHTLPIDGPIKVVALPGIRLPEGTDRDTLLRSWLPEQRSAIVNYKGAGVLVRAECAATHKCPLQRLVAGVKAFGESEFPGQTPLGIVLPFETAPGVYPDSLFVTGTEAQIHHMEDIATWSTSWVCFQAFPNRPITSHYACSYAGVPLPRTDYEKVADMTIDALKSSEQVTDTILRHGGDPETVYGSLELEYVKIRENGVDVDVWNVFLAPPTSDPDGLRAWRELIASLRPGDFLTGQLRAIAKPFKCGTCGCLRHPQGMCPTISAEGWMGFLPKPHAKKPALAGDAQVAEPEKSKIAVGGIERPAAKGDTKSASSTAKPGDKKGKAKDAKVKDMKGKGKQPMRGGKSKRD